MTRVNSSEKANSGVDNDDESRSISNTRCRNRTLLDLQSRELVASPDWAIPAEQPACKPLDQKFGRRTDGPTDRPAYPANGDFGNGNLVDHVTDETREFETQRFMGPAPNDRASTDRASFWGDVGSYLIAFP